MGTTTTASPITPGEETTVPELRFFQIDAEAIGRIAESVNLFRGDVSLPLELLSFRSRGGLKTSLTITCQSNVHREVNTWNVEAPTGILGVGWAIDFERIIAFRGDSTSPFDNRFYLIDSDGNRNLLVPVRREGAKWFFEMERYKFWEIVFFSKTSSWHIRTHDGAERQYGTTDDSRLRAVRWSGAKGNWTDSSIQGGQASFDVGWNLSALSNLFGDRIHFEYDNVEFPIGRSSTQSYTRASYLKAIVEPSGRRISLHYGDKIHNDKIREYEAPHVDPNPAVGQSFAFQDRYQTRFLDSITVSRADNPSQVVSTLRFSYTLAKLSKAVGEERYLWKRYLSSVAMVDENGSVLPGLTLDYEGFDGSAAVNLGALKSITYPEGGTAEYQYENRPIKGTALNRTLGQSDTGGGIPRIWFGSDYAVLVRYDSNQARHLVVNVYDWNGAWIGSQPLATHLAGELELATLNCEPREGWFLLIGRTSDQGTGPSLVAWAVTRRFGHFGEWTVQPLDNLPSLDLSQEYQVAVGAQFIAVAANDQSEIARYQQDQRTRTWVYNPLVLRNAGNYSLAASERLLTLSVYFPTVNQAELTLYRYDPIDFSWASTQLDSFGPVLWKEDFPKPSFALAGSLAAITYLISEDVSARRTVELGVRLYTWNDDLGNITIDELPQETRSINSFEPFAFSRLSRSLLGNAARLRRFNGNFWVEATLGPLDEGERPVAFAYADDLAIGASDLRARARSYDPYSDDFLLQVKIEGGDGPPQPTISGRYVTVRKHIYFRDPTGNLIQVGTLPGGAAHVANQGPNYFGYQLSDTQAFVHLMRNGVLAPTATALNERLFPEETGSGTLLTAPTAFATFTGETFDRADTITLYRLIDGQFKGCITDRVVTQVSVSAGIEDTTFTTFDYPGQGTTGVFGLVSQYSQARSITQGTSLDDAPNGYTITDFFDGRSAASVGTDEPYGLLSGLPRRTRIYNRAKQLVKEETHVWEVIEEISDLADSGKPLKLIGAYTRRKQRSVLHYPLEGEASEPLETTETYEYDEGNGEVSLKRATNFNSEQKTEIVEETSLFTYQEYPTLLEAHVWSPVIRSETAVDRHPIAIEATTWKPWLSSGESGMGWAPFRTYRGRNAKAQLTASDWANQTLADAADWWLTDEILQRDSSGHILERRSEDGRRRSWLYSRCSRIQVASFPDASLLDGEVFYLGFERYESTDGWTLGGSPSDLQQAIRDGDAHAGSAALLLSSNASGNAPLQRNISLKTSAPRGYVLSCWVKTLSDLAQGQVRWTVSTSTATVATSDLPSTGGEWAYMFVSFQLPGSPDTQRLDFRLVNGSNADILVDDIRFSPLLSAFQAMVYDPATLQETARLETNGATSRKGYDGFGRTVVEAAVDDASVNAIHATYASRLGNGGAFDPTAPNANLLLRPQSWGFLQRFEIGAQWRTDWATAQPDRWSAVGGALRYDPGVTAEASRIEFTAQPPARLARGMSLSAVQRTPLGHSFGLTIGNSLALIWDSTRAAWGCRDGSDTQWRTPRSLLNLSWDTYHTQLDAAQLPDTFPKLFGAAGLPLSPLSSVTVVSSGTSWRLTDPSGVLYYLVRDPMAPSRINVSQAPQSLGLYIQGKDVILFADGGQAFSQHFPQPVEGNLGILADGAVDFSNVTFFTDPQMELNFQDGAARNVQFQVADDRGFAGTVTVHDPVGRPAITTQLVRLSPDGDKLATYQIDLAVFDWTNFTISGLVVDQHPEAGGYPYTRVRFEDSPLGREVERGAPGRDFAIQGAARGPHTTRIFYGLNDGSLGLTAGKFLRETIVGPDGITSQTLRDQRGGWCAEVVSLKRRLTGGMSLSTNSTQLRTSSISAPLWATRRIRNGISSIA